MKKFALGNPPELTFRLRRHRPHSRVIALHRLLSFVAFSAVVARIFGHTAIDQVVALSTNTMSSLTSTKGTVHTDSPTILLIGSCGLDRLLTVSSYPAPDSKIRTTSYDEVGGGNAANTASGT